MRGRDLWRNLYPEVSKPSLAVTSESQTMSPTAAAVICKILRPSRSLSVLHCCTALSSNPKCSTSTKIRDPHFLPRDECHTPQKQPGCSRSHSMARSYCTRLSALQVSPSRLPCGGTLTIHSSCSSRKASQTLFQLLPCTTKSRLWLLLPEYLPPSLDHKH